MNNKGLRESNPAIDAHFAACKAELDSYPLVNGVIRAPEFVDWINCPVCSSDASYQWLVKWGGRYDICSNCSHHFLKNPLKAEILAELYNNSIADELDRQVNKNPFNRKYWELVYKKYINTLATLVDEDRPHLLDVGCGAGKFLATCVADGRFDSYGLDVYEDMLGKLDGVVDPRRLYSVVDVLEFNPSGKFNIITLWGVLEHLRDGNSIFNRMNYWLHLGGVVCALVPNINSRAIKILGASVPTLNPREHINFYTRKSLALMVEKFGFEIIDVYNELPVIDLMWPYVDQDDECLIEDIVRLDESYYHVFLLRKVRQLNDA